jgi:hypothetical protein
MQLFQKEKKLVTLEKYSRKKHKTHPSHEAVWIADVGFNAMTSPSEAYEPSSVHLWSSHTSTLSLRCPLGRRTFSFFLKKKRRTVDNPQSYSKQLGEHASSRRCWRAVCLGTVPAHQLLLTTKRGKLRCEHAARCTVP